MMKKKMKAIAQKPTMASLQASIQKALHHCQSQQVAAHCHLSKAPTFLELLNIAMPRHSNNTDRHLQDVHEGFDRSCHSRDGFWGAALQLQHSCLIVSLGIMQGSPQRMRSVFKHLSPALLAPASAKILLTRSFQAKLTHVCWTATLGGPLNIGW